MQPSLGALIRCSSIAVHINNGVGCEYFLSILREGADRHTQSLRIVNNQPRPLWMYREGAQLLCFVEYDQEGVEIYDMHAAQTGKLVGIGILPTCLNIGPLLPFERGIREGLKQVVCSKV